jgi:hypothetical protein
VTKRAGSSVRAAAAVVTATNVHMAERRSGAHRPVPPVTACSCTAAVCAQRERERLGQ